VIWRRAILLKSALLVSELLWTRLVRACIPGAIPPLRHELVELGFVLRHPQAIEEVTELALFFLKPAQRLLAIFVESAIA